MNLNKGLVRIQTKTNIGTGFIVSSSGIVFTCKHVIENFHPEDKDDNFILLFNLNEDVGRFEGEKYEYKILFPDLNDETYPYDFAILYIIPKSPKIFDYVKLGLEPSNIMRENKPLKLIGLSPDENWTKSKAYDGSLLNYTVFKSSKCLDIDTPITPGMSGGPVYSQHSESVIGLSIDQALRITKTKIKEVKIIDFRAYAITMSKIQKIIKEQDVLPEIIKKEILDKFQITKTFDNYDSMMEVSDETPISFEYIEPNSVVKYVNHAAIEAGIIIRIERLHEEINNLMFNSSKKWVLLYGDSGMSKTSQAKIILHDIRQRYIEQNKIINICIIDNIKKISNENKTLTLEELIQVIKQSTEEWLLLLDDLHDSTSGKISEKLKLISNLPKDKVYLIATSRLSLDFLKEFCEGISRARKSIDYFKEVNFLLYNKEINKAKQKLIESLRPELNRDEMFKIEYSKYSTNFIFLILAIKYWKPGETHSLIEGLQNFLEKEFSSILEKNRFLKPKILFRTFVGACFEGVFDEDISYDYFSTKEDSEEDI
ncbi:MAG: serine protease, partial [Candidatus Odinarchaeota archaeon]